MKLQSRPRPLRQGSGKPRVVPAFRCHGGRSAEGEFIVNKFTNVIVVETLHTVKHGLGQARQGLDGSSARLAAHNALCYHLGNIPLSLISMPSCDVSVVIPAYNAASFIVDALDSIARQSVLPKEVIVVNDGSTDQTQKVVTDWIARNAALVPVTLLSQPNQGLPATRNNAIKQACGRWIALLDADDIWEQEHLAELLGGIACVPDAVGAYGAGRLLVQAALNPQLYDDFWDNPSMALGKAVANSQYREIHRDIYSRLIQGNFIKPSSLMFLRATALEIGLFNEQLRTGEDREFLVRLIFAGKLVYTPVPITQYRWHDDNISNGKNAKRNAENILRVLNCILHNSKLGLSTAQLQQCRDEASKSSKAYLYACAKAGASDYLRGLAVVRKLFGPQRMVAALNVKHIAHCLLP